MVPEHPPPSRGGIEAGLRGASNRGPGCYGPSPVSGADAPNVVVPGQIILVYYRGSCSLRNLIPGHRALKV